MEERLRLYEGAVKQINEALDNAAYGTAEIARTIGKIESALVMSGLREDKP
jgi:hypothetical protein